MKIETMKRIEANLTELLKATLIAAPITALTIYGMAALMAL